MRVKLDKRPNGRYSARLAVRDDRKGHVITVGVDGNDWIEATALAAQEMLQMRRAGMVNMRAPQAKRLAAVALLASPPIRAAVQAGMDTQRQAIEAVKAAAVQKGLDVGKVLASKAEDIAGKAVQSVTNAIPGGAIAYEAGVQVWRQVKKIPFLSKLFG